MRTFIKTKRPSISNKHLSLQELQPLHSEWSKCYRQSSDTGLRGPPGSQSAPETEQWKRQRFWLECAGGRRRKTGGERAYSCLSCDMGTAHHFGPGQGLFPLGSLSQGHQCRHVWGENTQFQLSRFLLRSEVSRNWHHKKKMGEDFRVRLGYLLKVK